ncbi:amidohydrolase family protein [Paenibacillus abyssi]|uniref:Amidohydrolase-related domain-containing protein n=1 Tax=Paenibacillus abyssi TaxID=1340531 RepID=A0A917FM62_9BACL|nr:amidohydrolase family protein [Paenibacillus abyssi]GGF93163.1 hypothetical protein GCM10010916_08170 [Paenibacillus abyssi]
MNSIMEAVSKIRIIDGHEHIVTYETRRNENVDFFGLLHYLDSDMITAGMERGALERHHQRSDEEMAELFLNYWHRTSNTTYAKMLQCVAKDLYGLEKWDVKSLLEMNEQVRRKSADPTWYTTVLKERSGIDMTLTLQLPEVHTTNVDFELFRPVMFLDFTYKIRSLKDIEEIEKESKIDVHTFKDYLNAVDAILKRFVDEGMVATKLGHAYWRTLECGKPTLYEAETGFNRIRTSPIDEQAAPEQLRALQDYLIHFIIQRSIAYGMPIQIHTGHHETSPSGNGNVLTNSQVTGLIPLLHEYKEAKFVLLHSGFPYHQEYLSIAKNFPNVYTDLTWVYIISPTAAKQILHQMIEMVPQSKILGFGGDYIYVEGAYSHQKLMRNILSGVLVEKVGEGALSEEEAVQFAEKVLRHNLIDLYKLNV